ncbi:MAG: FIST C-terminal domain-containing protein [Gammaproteobacteria bacterium]|nr:FIST C-terminal domain-containing protein [Gammaproteobacteria bacterium]MCP5137775.1 FIST C-terminal domain-containing protein [Gammaproteobacteria bacterium]
MKSRLFSAEELINLPTSSSTFTRHPDFVLAFLPATEHLATRLLALGTRFPDTLIAGCNALRQFLTGGIVDDGVVQLFWFDDPGHRAWCEIVSEEEDGFIDIAPVLSRLCQQQPDSAIVLVDGIHFPVHKLLDTMRDVPELANTTLVGGLASKALDPHHFLDDEGAWVFCNGRIHHRSALVIGLDGIDIQTAIVRGWEPASPVFTVTEAHDRVLCAIDDKCATDWYRDYFTVDGILAELPSSSYCFPLIIDSPDPSRRRIYRTMAVFDEPKGCITFAGDIHTGDKIRLGIGDAASLIQAASELEIGDADACLLFSCTVREVILQDKAEDELLALNDKLGDTPLTGFFTFGEIGPSAANVLAYYNQTGVLALLRERKA